MRDSPLRGDLRYYIEITSKMLSRFSCGRSVPNRRARNAGHTQRSLRRAQSKPTTRSSLNVGVLAAPPRTVHARGQTGR